MNSVAITILGKEYKVKTGDDADYVRALARYVNEKVLDVQTSGGATSTMDLVAVVMLSMADDVAILRDELAREREAVTQKVGRMIERLDEKDIP